MMYDVWLGTNSLFNILVEADSEDEAERIVSEMDFSDILEKIENQLHDADFYINEVERVD